VTLPAQAFREVQFVLGPEARRYWSTTARDWVLDTSVFDIYVGGDSTAELTATFEVTDSQEV
jgi:beta-glucosidase